MKTTPVFIFGYFNVLRLCEVFIFLVFMVVPAGCTVYGRDEPVRSTKLGRDGENNEDCSCILCLALIFYFNTLSSLLVSFLFLLCFCIFFANSSPHLRNFIDRDRIA